MSTEIKMTTKYFFSQPLSFRVMEDGSYLGRSEYFTIGDFIIADSEGVYLLDAKGDVEKYASHLCELVAQNCASIDSIDAFTAQWNGYKTKEKRQILVNLDKQFTHRLRDDHSKELAIFKTYDEAEAFAEAIKDTHRRTGLKIEARHP